MRIDVRASAWGFGGMVRRCESLAWGFGGMVAQDAHQTQHGSYRGLFRGRTHRQCAGALAWLRYNLGPERYDMWFQIQGNAHRGSA